MKKSISIILSVLMILSLGMSAFASQIVPSAGGGPGTLAENGIANGGGTALEVISQNGFLKLARVPKSDGTYSENTTKATISKSLTTELPTEGVVKITFGMKNTNGIEGNIKLYSGSTEVLDAKFTGNEGGNTITTNNFAASSIISSTKYGMQQQEWLCTNEVVFDYTNNRVYAQPSRPGVSVKANVYYADDGTKFADAAAAAEAGVTVPGLPITTVVDEVMQEAPVIDKIQLLPYNKSNGNILYSAAWASYDFVKIVHAAEDGTETVYLNDTFDDSTKMIADYGWWLDGSTAYYKTESGFGIMETKKNSNAVPLPTLSLGKTYNSGKVAVEFTIEAKLIYADGTASPRQPYTSNTSAAKGLVNFMGGDTVTAMLGYSRSGTSGKLWVDPSAFDSSTWKNALKPTTAFNTAGTETAYTYKFVFDLDNAAFTAYRYVDGAWESAVYHGSPSFTLARDTDGNCTIDSIMLSEYMYVASAGSGTTGTLGISNINVYEVDESGVALPGFFDAEYNEITTAAAGDAVAVYIPVNNQDEKDITVVIASFAADGTFKSMRPVDISANTGINLVKLPVAVDASAAAGDYIRVMVWDNMNSIMPYIVPVDLTVVAAE